MSNEFVAEVRAFPFNFAPKGWAFCDGQIIPISQNTALFSLLGTYYGGDGKSNFGLPNLQGDVAIGMGQGPGLRDYFIGENGGSDSVTLLLQEMPAHPHPLKADGNNGANNSSPANASLSFSPNTHIYTNAITPLAQFSPMAIAPAGGGQPHNNMMPYLTLNFCIALQGIYPPRG